MAKKHRGLFAFLRGRLWERRHGKITQIALLPHPYRCFRGELEFALPLGFRLVKMRADTLFFARDSEMLLIVHKSRMRRRLRSITQMELVRSFRYVTPICSMPVIRHGFLRHSPSLRADWSGQRSQVSMLYMVQVHQTVYVLLMTGRLPRMQQYRDGVLASVQVHPELVMQHSQNAAKK